MTETPDETTPSAPVEEPPAALQGQLVRRATPGIVRSRLPRDLGQLRDRVADLARNPAAVATATLVTSVAVNIAREAVKSGARGRNRAPAPVLVTGYVVQHVHVWHHVVSHRVVTSVPGAVVPRPPGS